MSTTRTHSGTLKIDSVARVMQTGDEEGTLEGRHLKNVTYSAAGGSAPTISGYLVGTVSPAIGTDYLLAAATAPFGAYAPGFVVAGTKIKEIIFYNTDTTYSVVVARKAANGAPILDATLDSVTLQPGAQFVLTFPAGTAALTTGSNDGITLTPSGGTPAVFILVKYGP